MGIPSRYVTSQLGQLSLAFLWGHLIEPSFGWGKGRYVTSAVWQVTLCDHIWCVSSHSNEASTCTLPYLLVGSQTCGCVITSPTASRLNEHATDVCMCACVCSLRLLLLQRAQSSCMNRAMQVRTTCPGLLCSRAEIASRTYCQNQCTAMLHMYVCRHRVSCSSDQVVDRFCG